MNQQRWIKSSLDPFKVHLQMSISGQTGRRRGNMGGHLDVDRVTWKRFPLRRFSFPPYFDTISSWLYGIEI